MAIVDTLPGTYSKPDHCVIGIGASAGGLGALRRFFGRMPPDPGVACVVIVHLSPEHESHLAQMLQPYTQMPVCQVVETTVLAPNRVYVIPPNANLNSIDTHLRLTRLEGRRAQRAPIDHFLRTLAATHRERAIGLILSGAGSDGALGIRHIKEHGGLTVAQDPRDAEYHSMPQAAIATGTVDFVLPAAEMPEEILHYCGTQPWVGRRGEDGDLVVDDALLLEKILEEVRLHTGQEFGMFRREALLQRVRRRMRLRHAGSLAEYLAALQSHSGEPRALYNDLLLNVTEFFRDAQFYETIGRLLGEILASKQHRDPRVRIWSIGCSTGEEAYSLAMLLIEHTASRSDEPLLQVFASELSPDVLQCAREGVYPQEIAASISQERLERFFVYENGRYRVRRELREMVIFANHDLFKDPPFSYLDLIVCRRLLGDLQPAMRQGALNLFYYALEPHGILMVDPRDQVQAAELFTSDRAHPGLLRRTGGPPRLLQLPGGLAVMSRAPAPSPPAGPQPQQKERRASLVEELDSTREELQSVNEELISINQENRSRIETLTELSDDLQHLLDSTGFATVLLDRELRILRFAPLAATLLRLRESDIGRPLAELKHHLRYDKLVADIRRVVEQLAVLEVEVESDGGRWFMLRAQPYRTPRRGLEGATLLFIDITDRKRAELALREADRRKEEFLAVLAHELRNPLAPIVAGVDLLRTGPEDRALVQRVTGTMARQTKQLVRLVDDLLEVQRINEDKLTLRIQPVSIGEVVRDAVAAIRPVVENLEHELTIELPEDPLTVAGDAARLTQVLGNLLNNAVRYTPPRGRIALRARRDDKHALISVQDNGRGLSSQSLANVFEMFFQARESGVSNSGLGIGLTLARKLVELHGGTIEAQSAGTNMGSTFTVRLSLVQGDAADSLPEREEGRDPGRQHRVLIVDDNADAAETLYLLLKSLGTREVRTASNGRDALVVAAELRPDVVLLDLGMPGMDGYELARRMRAETWGRGALLVALTGWGQEQYRRRSREAGFDRHMIKPADAEALRVVLDSR